jgi:hypothetical protein
MTDDDLLTFDYKRLAGNEPELGPDDLHDQWTRGDAEKALEAHGEIYRAQLVAAHFAERWCEGRLRGPAHSTEHEEGFEEALRDMAAHLRKGDLLPGGTLYRLEMGE